MNDLRGFETWLKGPIVDHCALLLLSPSDLIISIYTYNSVRLNDSLTVYKFYRYDANRACKQQCLMGDEKYCHDR